MQTATQVRQAREQCEKMGMYVLAEDGKTPVLASSPEQWGAFMERFEAKRVNDCTFTDPQGNSVRVSTVFLGLEHNHGEGKPHLFETMLFGGPFDQDCKRTSTWNEALEMHQDAIAWIKSNYDPAL